MNEKVRYSNILLELRLRLYWEIYSDVGQVETQCGILARVLGVGFSLCAVPTFSDSPSILIPHGRRYEKSGSGVTRSGFRCWKLA